MRLNHSNPEPTGQESSTKSGWYDAGIDAILADPRLTASAKLVVIALVRNFAWFASSCYPSDITIAFKIGMSPGHVQRALKLLEECGYIRRVSLHGRRTIYLLWRLGDQVPFDSESPSLPDGSATMASRDDLRAGAQADQATIRAGDQIDQSPIPLGAGGDCAPASDKRTEFERKNGYVTDFSPHPQKNVQEGPMVPPVASPPESPPQPPQPLLAEIKGLPGSGPGQVRTVANRLATWLMDMASLGYYITVLAKCAAGTICVEAVVAAFNAATRAKGSARKPGAIFCWTLNNYVKPPLPSEIRPACASTQSPDHGRVPPTPAVVPIPGISPQEDRLHASAGVLASTMRDANIQGDQYDVSGKSKVVLPREEEIKDLREILLAHKSPFAALARMRLKELGASAE